MAVEIPNWLRVLAKQEAHASARPAAERQWPNDTHVAIARAARDIAWDRTDDTDDTQLGLLARVIGEAQRAREHCVSMLAASTAEAIKCRDCSEHVGGEIPNEGT